MKKSIIESLRKQGIRLYDTSSENIKKFSTKAVTGKLTKLEISAFLDSSKEALGAITAAFKAALNTHENLSAQKSTTLNKVLDTAQMLIKDDMTSADRNKVVDLLMQVAAMAERMDNSDKEHQKSLFKMAMVPITFIAMAGVLIITRGKVKLKL